MKNLVLTIAMGEHGALAKITHPSLRAYAKKIKADFKVISKKKVSKTTPHWEKFQIYELLKKYDRIIYFDTDIIVRPDCPDLFKIVPKEQLGMFNEAPYTDRSKELMIDICQKYGITLPSWNGKYYNSGLMVIGQEQKELFKKPNKEHYSFYEQSYLNAIIAKKNIPVFDLDYKFNRMVCMDFLGEERFDSFVIHYAGCPNIETVMSCAKEDLKKWRKDKKTGFKYQKHIWVKVTGGLGDQVEAEPSLRYMITKAHKDDDIIISTHFPRIFKHLGVKVFEHGKEEFPVDTPYLVIDTLPSPQSPTQKTVSSLLIHQVDFASIATMRRTLPTKDKQVCLQVELEDYQEVISLTGIKDLKNYVVVHAGAHWANKTFPKKWWQDVVNGLKQPVILIGQSDDTRGFVPIKCPKNGIDLRNKLSLSGLFTLLSMAGTLISNDSAPIHIAGAFDNKIILIPTCKHADHLLPWRKGSQNYKAVAMCKKLLLDDLMIKTPLTGVVDLSSVPNKWSDYLPNPKDVCQQAMETVTP